MICRKKEAYLQHLVDHCHTGREPGHYPLRSASSPTVESRDGWKVAYPGRVIAKCKMKGLCPNPSMWEILNSSWYAKEQP
jgi:hypothetical protein